MAPTSDSVPPAPEERETVDHPEHDPFAPLLGDWSDPTIPLPGDAPRPPGAESSAESVAAISNMESDVRAVEGVWSQFITADLNPGQTVKRDGTSLFRSVVVNERILGPKESKSDYELREQLGQGGMGVVYEAMQTAFGRTIAIKQLRADREKDAAKQDEFLAEAAVTGDLDHPNVVPVYDLGRDGEGKLFYAMKRVKGRSWQACMKEYSQEENIDILLRVADAVAFAHSKGVIHCDLKPENVMLGEFGEVLVMDWGMAVSITPEGKAKFKDDLKGVGGTPAFMAPEMAACDMERLGPASDIYLLGGILYQIVTGLTPHTGPNVLSCLYAAKQNSIQPTHKHGELVDIAMNAMATEPAARYPTVKALQQALREYKEHAESIALADQAGEDLEAGEQGGGYDHYAQALYGYRQALKLWPGNDEARTGEIRTARHYAGAAFLAGDLDLALALLDPERPEHANLRSKVANARERRLRRRQAMARLRWLTVGLAVATIIAMAVAIIAIKRAKAEVSKAFAKSQYEGYVAKVGLAHEMIQEEMRASAERLLLACPEAMRNWEWGRLDYVTELRGLELGPEIAAAGFLADGDRILSAGKDGCLRTFEIKTGKEVAVQDLLEPARAMALHPDGSRLIVAGAERVRWYGRAADGSLEPGLAIPAKALALAIAPDGRRVAVVGEGGLAQIRDGDGGELLHDLSGHEGQVRAAAFSPDGTLLLIGGEDKNTRLWEVETGRLVRVLRYSEVWEVYAVGFSTDGRRMLTGDYGWEAKAWSIHDGDYLFELNHNGTVHDVAYSLDGETIMTASGDRRVLLWDAETHKARRALGDFDHAVLAARFSPDGDRILAVDAGGTAHLRYKDRRIGVTRLVGHDGMIRFVAISPDGRYVATAGGDKTARLWSRKTGEPIRVFAGHERQLNWVSFSPDGTRLATASDDDTARVWDVATGREIRAFRGHTARVKCAAFSPDGARLATASRDHTARIWLVATGATERILKGHDRRLRSALFSPDGTRVVTASLDKTARIWDAATGEQLHVLRGNEDGLREARYSPDGRWIATAGEDWTARLYDPATGAEARVLRGHTQPVFALAWTEDGQRLFTAGGDGVVGVWDAATGAMLLSLDEHEGAVRAVAYHGPSRTLASGGYDLAGLLWHAKDWRSTHAEPTAYP